jgi:L-fucose mutarotase/ribose pyranase (RbsD/FucU family)
MALKYFIMAEKKVKKYNRYQLYLTETTANLLVDLQKYRHNIKDILNAGIVLYDQSDNPTRAMAEMRANCNIDEEIDNLQRRLDRAIKEKKTDLIVIAEIDKLKPPKEKHVEKKTG